MLEKCNCRKRVFDVIINNKMWQANEHPTANQHLRVEFHLKY